MVFPPSFCPAPPRLRVEHAVDLLHPVDVDAELGHAVDLGIVQPRDDVRPRRRIEHPSLGRNPAQRLAVVIADVDVGPDGCDLAELIRRDGHAIHAAANEEEVHRTPILYG